jgi:transketolase
MHTAVLDPRDLRRHILFMAHHGRSAHVGCALSLVEICAALYGVVMRYDRSDPLAPERDLLVLSKGHGVMALYACFRELGWLGDEDLRTYLANGTRLRGVSEANVPGCEVTGGSLGHGLPVAVGMAYGLLRRQSERRVWCIVGDGEMNEGAIWEAMLFAAHHRLVNLTMIVDANGFQAMGQTEDVIRLEPLAAKCAAFGFETVECDGHDIPALVAAFHDGQDERTRPRAVIARTVKGSGVSFMAADNRWHYRRLDDSTLAAALGEIR